MDNGILRQSRPCINPGQHLDDVGILVVHRNRPLQILDLQMAIIRAAGIAQPVLGQDVDVKRQGGNLFTPVYDHDPVFFRAHLPGHILFFLHDVIYQFNAPEQHPIIVAGSHALHINGNTAAKEGIGGNAFDDKFVLIRKSQGIAGF